MKYRLLSDTAYHAAGEIFTKIGNGFFPVDSNDGYAFFPPSLVSEWFEEVQEPTWTDEDMIAFAEYFWLDREAIEKKFQEFKIKK